LGFSHFWKNYFYKQSSIELMKHTPKPKDRDAPKFVEQATLNRYAQQFTDQRKPPEMPFKSYQENTHNQLQNLIQQNMALQKSNRHESFKKPSTFRSDNEDGDATNQMFNVPLDVLTDSFSKVLSQQQEEFTRKIEEQKRGSEEYIANMTDMYLKALKEQKDSSMKYLKQILKNQMRDKQEWVERDDAQMSELKKLSNKSQQESLIEEIKKELREEVTKKRNEEQKINDFMLDQLMEIKTELKQSAENNIVGNTMTMVTDHLDRVLLKLNEVQIKEQHRINSAFDMEPKIDLILSKVEQIFELREHSGDSRDIQHQKHDMDREIAELREEARQLRFKSKTLESEIETFHAIESEQFDWKFRVLGTVSKFFENPIQKNNLKVHMVFSSKEDEVNKIIIDHLKNLLKYGTTSKEKKSPVQVEYTFAIASEYDTKVRHCNIIYSNFYNSNKRREIKMSSVKMRAFMVIFHSLQKQICMFTSHYQHLHNNLTFPIFETNSNMVTALSCLLSK
jgi:hypothetical protein